jgi:hypothetical protein
MPTKYPRMMITRTPDVERVIAAGAVRWPDKTGGAILVALACEALEQAPRSRGLTRFSGGRAISSAQVEELLDDD